MLTGRNRKQITASREDFLLTCSTDSGHICACISGSVTYHEDGTVAGFHADRPKVYRRSVTKEVRDGCGAHLLPGEAACSVIYSATQDSVVLEIQRGCIRGCRFCQAGQIYRPVRERDALSF